MCLREWKHKIQIQKTDNLKHNQKENRKALTFPKIKKVERDQKYFEVGDKKLSMFVADAERCTYNTTLSRISSELVMPISWWLFCELETRLYIVW